jgi:hypothetical protein
MLERLKAEAAMTWSVLTTRYWAEHEVNGRGRAVSAFVALGAAVGSVTDTVRYREW